MRVLQVICEDICVMRSSSRKKAMPELLGRTCKLEALVITENYGVRIVEPWGVALRACNAATYVPSAKGSRQQTAAASTRPDTFMDFLDWGYLEGSVRRRE